MSSGCSSRSPPLAVVFRLQLQLPAPRWCLQAAAPGLRPSLLSSGCSSSPQLEVNTHEHPGAERLCVRMHVGRTARWGRGAEGVDRCSEPNGTPGGSATPEEAQVSWLTCCYNTTFCTFFVFVFEMSPLRASQTERDGTCWRPPGAQSPAPPPPNPNPPTHPGAVSYALAKEK